MAVGTAVVAGTAHHVAKRTAENSQAEAAAQQQAAPAAAAPDPYEELKQLGALHEQGILTDEEFAAQKAKILG
jgi:membrane protease subunit (stomatin/prohibitin family)